MIIENFKLVDFLKQEPELISEYVTVLRYVKPIKTKKVLFDMKLKHIEFIKENLYSDNDSALIDIIRKVQGIKEKKPILKIFRFKDEVSNMPVIKFFGILNSIKEQMDLINRAEANSLPPSYPNIKWEQVNGSERMSIFGIYNTLESLSGGDALKYKKYMNMNYSEVFTILLMRKTASDLQHEMNQIKTK